MDNICSIAANRYLVRQNTSAFNRHQTIWSCYQSYPEKAHVSFTTFYSNVRYRKPHRLTDLCEICEMGKMLYKELIDIATQNDLDIQRFLIEDQDSDFNQYKLFLNQLEKNPFFFSKETQINEALILISEIEEIQFNRKVANNQRKAYNRMRTDTNLLKNSVLIDIDFKQKIIIGDGPEMVSGEYFERQQRSCLGVGIYSTDLTKNQVELMNVDLISKADSFQTAQKAISGLRFLRQQGMFQGKNKYILWCDCGPHFRCGEFMYFVFDYLNKGIDVQVNFFAEKHGKNSRDQHFSVISHFIRMESFEKKITAHKK